MSAWLVVDFSPPEMTWEKFRSEVASSMGISQIAAGSKVAAPVWLAQQNKLHEQIPRVQFQHYNLGCISLYGEHAVKQQASTRGGTQEFF